MLRARFIPALLLRGPGLVKTVKFADPKYVGDPINAVKLFNDLEVDELVLLDILATREGRNPDYGKIREIVSEAFMPVGYGGGVNSVQQAEQLFKLGCEKVVVTTAAHTVPSLVGEIAARFGSQSVVVGIDVRKNWLRRHACMVAAGSRPVQGSPEQLAAEAEARGAGEILLNDISRDGTMQGYDLELVARVSAAVSVPVVACGGAGSVADLGAAVKAGASAAAAGSLFVYKGPHRAVLINYLTSDELAHLVQLVEPQRI
jgi:cyclase